MWLASDEEINWVENAEFGTEKKEIPLMLLTSARKTLLYSRVELSLYFSFEWSAI